MGRRKKPDPPAPPAVRVLVPDAREPRLLNRDGTIAVDPAKYPAIHAALVRGQEYKEKRLQRWREATELRKQGLNAKADRLVKKILGVKGKPMSEEKKAWFREYTEANKEKIIADRKQKREQERMLKERMKPGGGPARRKS